MDLSMIKRTVLALALLGGTAGAAWSDARPLGSAGDFGAGLIIGDPTGLTGKWWLSQTRAVDLALAWDLSGPENRFETHADYLWHFPLHIAGMEGRLPLYVGVGGRLLAGHNARVGVRVPFGISYLSAQVPFEVFAEVTPLLDFTPDSDTSVSAALGARFYFK